MKISDNIRAQITDGNNILLALEETARQKSDALWSYQNACEQAQIAVDRVKKELQELNDTLKLMVEAEKESPIMAADYSVDKDGIVKPV